jgi:hypothetical protein
MYRFVALLYYCNTEIIIIALLLLDYNTEIDSIALLLLRVLQHKKAVVLTSRVHPGECNSSWMMKGFLDYLTGNTADAKVKK